MTRLHLSQIQLFHFTRKTTHIQEQRTSVYTSDAIGNVRTKAKNADVIRVASAHNPTAVGIPVESVLVPFKLHTFQYR